MINSGGNLFLSKAAGWHLMESKTIPNFDATHEYKVKVVYLDGYVRIYCDDALYFTAFIGNLPGASVGFRAATSGTEFGKNVTIDTTATTGLGTASNVNTLTKIYGDGGVSLDNGVYTTAAGQTMAVADGTMENNQGGSFSVKIHKSASGGDNGIFCGLTSTSVDNWEAVTYFFFFIDAGGSVRFTRVFGNGVGWNEIDANVHRMNSAAKPLTDADGHTLTVTWDGNGFAAFVDGEIYFASNEFKFNGNYFGVRANRAGVEYSEMTYVKY